MIDIENELIDPKKVKTLTTHYHIVKKKTIKKWFSSEEVFEEVRTNSEKIIMSNGLPIKKEEIHYKEDGVYRTMVTYQNGKPIIKETTDPNGIISSKTIIEYYPSGKEKSRNTFKNGKIDSTYNYKYDEQGNLIEHYSWNSWQSKPYPAIKYSISTVYQGGYKIVTHLNLNDNSKLVYYYNSQNKLVKFYKYDKTGKLIQNTETLYDNKGQQISRKLDGIYLEQFKYDKWGNTIWMEWYPNYDYYPHNGEDKYKKAITTYDLEYDYEGNWIGKRQFRDGVYNRLQVREIEYIE